MAKKKQKLVEIGWREWVALPELKIDNIKAKIDTGARTSALHAFDIQFDVENGEDIVLFKVHPLQKNSKESVSAKAKLLEMRSVKSSNSKKELRPVILTTIKIPGESWEIELTLTNRKDMGFRMLLGREALRGHFLVNPGRSFLLGKPKKAKKAKKKSKKSKSK